MPEPLHPAVVHFPIALAVIIPLFAFIAAVAISKRFVPPHTWIAIVLLQGLLVGSAWFALETGEDQEERVEEVVAENYIEEHEEAAERFMWLAAIGLGVLGTGLLPGGAGAVGRVIGVLATIVILGAAIPVGHSGGELVYKHGAANAYLPAAASSIEDD